jgi:tetratricopeptide (TPR) repeat protein
LKQNEEDVITLANLAVVEMDLNQAESAEKHIARAIELAPEDAFSLGVLGRLRFQQKRFDDALKVLSRAAKLDPQNAEIQNYLGLVLSESGLRPAAESALRRAIQLRPAYGSAHQNLAVVYVTQDPPLVELARYHYGKSLAAGAPQNRDLEKLIESKRGAQ